MSNKYLILFFVLTLGWTWGAGFLPVILNITGTPLGTFLFYFGAGAPSIVAAILVFTTYPKQAKNDYFKRCLDIRKMSIKWTLFTTLFWVINASIGTYIAVVCLGYEMPEMSWIKLLIKMPYFLPVLILLSILSGPLNEEFGWRGYALDRLFIKFGFLKASLGLGFIWAIWHLPWYFTPGQAQYLMAQTSLWDCILFIISTMLLSIVVSFVYIETQRSVIAAAYVHMASNFFTSQLLANYTQPTSNVIRYVKIVMCLGLMIYTITSKQFKEKFEKEIVQIEMLIAR